MYQAELGRFLTRDPLPQKGQPILLYDNNGFGRWLDRMRNQYGYVNGSPTNYQDPLGLEPANADDFFSVTWFFDPASNHPPHRGNEPLSMVGSTRTIKSYKPCPDLPNIGVVGDQEQEFVDPWYASPRWENRGEIKCPSCPTADELPGSTIVVHGCFAGTYYLGERHAADAMIPLDIHFGYRQPRILFTYAMPQALELDRAGADRVAAAMADAKQFLLSMGRVNEAQTQQAGIDCLNKVREQL